RRLWFVEERRIVQSQLIQSVAKFFVLISVYRIESGKDHRLDFFKTWKGFRSRARAFSNRVPNLNVSYFFDRGGQKPDFADSEFIDRSRTRTIHSYGLDLVVAASIKETDLHSRTNRAVDYAKQNDDAAIRVVPRIKYQGLKWRAAITLRRRHVANDRLQHLMNTGACFSASENGIVGFQSNQMFDLFYGSIRFGAR